LVKLLLHEFWILNETKVCFWEWAFVEGQIAAALPNEGSSTCIMFGASTGLGHHLQ
jgi:hypothetical protein